MWKTIHTFFQKKIVWKMYKNQTTKIYETDVHFFKINQKTKIEIMYFK